MKRIHQQNGNNNCFDSDSRNYDPAMAVLIAMIESENCRFDCDPRDRDCLTGYPEEMKPKTVKVEPQSNEIAELKKEIARLINIVEQHSKSNTRGA
jgi:hypothetical protein